MMEISIVLFIFLLGIALMIGSCAGMLLMALFCSNLRAERDEWERKYLALINKEV